MASWQSFSRIAGSVYLASVVLAAGVTAQWRPVDVATAPPTRTGFSLLPLPTGDLLLFGGDLANPNATEWLWDGVAWRPTTIGVPRRINAAVADFGAPGTLIYGGSDGSGFRTDTWRSFDGVSWFDVTGPVTPGVLQNTSACSVPGEDKCLLIGLTLGGLWETWIYTPGTNWAAGPSFTASHAHVVADTVRGEAMLFVEGVPTGEVKRWVGNSWQNVGTFPGSVAIGELAFEPHRARAVLLQAFSDRPTAEWDGLALGPSPAPSGAFVNTSRTAMAFHTPRSETVLVTNYVNSIETWRWTPQPGPAAFPFAAPCVSQIFRLGLVPGDQPLLGSVHRLRGSGLNGSFLTLSALGLSHTQTGGVPLPLTIPFSPSNCQLRVDGIAVNVLGSGLPVTQLVSLPLVPSLLGERYNAQMFQFGAAGVLDATNALEVQIGLPLPDYEVLESFASAVNRDPRTSGDRWAGGAAMPAFLGGDGRHGSFDATFGTLVAPGVYEWSTDNQTIPASATLTGAASVVTDGRFFFTDFTVPAGVTVQFVGTAPVQIFVRGQVDVQGTVANDAADMPWFVPTVGPAVGQRVSTFVARLPGLTPRPGQPGGLGGAGGGRGGDGGTKCLNAGPIVVGGVFVTDGQPGQDVRVSAGHAYAASAVGTGGRGSAMFPATGIALNTVLISSVYRDETSPGGSGGGFWIAGATSAVPTLATFPLLASGPAPANSAAFPILPFPASAPPGYSSLEHFAVGGSGGGGGGSHSFGTVTSVGDSFMAGHGGSGGGGVIVVRSGGSQVVGAAGQLRATGGRGVLITGDSAATTLIAENTAGVSSPGGGGSGGSVLLQADSSITVQGSIDTSGGAGSRTGFVNPALLNLQSQAGAGSPGYFRLEATGGASAPGATTVPTFSAANNVGPLNDRDALTGSRSTWLLPATTALPAYQRYELLVDVNGLPTLFSDDPAVSPLPATDPNGAAVLRFQGARLDPLTGQAVAGTHGPWRTTLAAGTDSLNRDRAQVVRFDLVLNKALGPIVVRELRIVWR